MKITEKEVMEFINLLEEGRQHIDGIRSLSDTARPLLREGISLLSENLAEFKPMIKKLSLFMVINRINCISLYEDNGFTREEAILLSISDNIALKEAFNSYKTKQTK